jgi:hypothetical protein
MSKVFIRAGIALAFLGCGIFAAGVIIQFRAAKEQNMPMLIFLNKFSEAVIMCRNNRNVTYGEVYEATGIDLSKPIMRKYFIKTKTLDVSTTHI